MLDSVCFLALSYHALARLLGKRNLVVGVVVVAQEGHACFRSIFIVSVLFDGECIWLLVRLIPRFKATPSLILLPLDVSAFRYHNQSSGSRSTHRWLHLGS